jgi:hypothetical protein
VFVSGFVTKLGLDRPSLACAGSVLDGVGQGTFSLSILYPKIKLRMTEQKSENVYRSMLNSSHQSSLSTQEGVGIGTIKKHELGPSIVVVSGCQVQEIAVLVLNVVLEDAGLQSVVKIPT